MRYVLAYGRSPLPSLGGSLVRPRPVIPLVLGAPSGQMAALGLLDTGAVEERHALSLGIELSQAEERPIALAARAGPLRCRYATVELEITDGQETFQWSAVVGFVPTRPHYPLLGYAGFLQFFDVEFQGAAQQVVLVPNHSFRGTVT